MSTRAITNPFPIILNQVGGGLNGGKVYIGLPDQDPETNPQTVYWDEDNSDVAAQPLATIGGYITRSGTPAQVYVPGSYSVRVRDKFGRQVYYAAHVIDSISEFLEQITGPAGSGYIEFAHDQTYPAKSVGRKEQNFVSPMDAPFNAVGDGVTDDTAAILAALTHCATKGVAFDGGLNVYAVSGNVQVTLDDLRIEMLRLKQLTPDAVNRRTFLASNCNRLKIGWLEVNRNGTGSQGSLADAAGIWITGGVGHDIGHLEAYGNGKGTGVVIVNCFDSVFQTIVGRNISFDEPAATDDRVQGVWLILNQRCHFGTIEARSLGGNANVTYPARFSRGISLSANTRIGIGYVIVANVDQGVDLSGDNGNLFINIGGGNVKDCVTFGVKVANSGHCVNVNNVIAEDCGLAGFVVSGPSQAGQTYKGEDINFYGCRSRNPGSNLFGAGRGFWVQPQPLVPADVDFPKNVNFYNCIAEDTQNTPTMAYGFQNEVLPDFATGKINQLFNCKSFRHVTAMQVGFVRLEYAGRGTGTQTIPTSTLTKIAGWGNVDTNGDGGAGMYDSLQPTRLTIKMAGWYEVFARATFATNSTGFRTLRLLKNNVNLPAALDSRAAVPATVTVSEAGTYRYFAAGDYLEVQVEQNSGGNLTIDQANSEFSVRQVRSA